MVTVILVIALVLGVMSTESELKEFARKHGSEVAACVDASGTSEPEGFPSRPSMT